jgi:putative transposase
MFASRTIISNGKRCVRQRKSRFKKEPLDELLGSRRQAVFERDGLLDELKKALAERILNAGMDHHLGQESEQAAGNFRNGASAKTVVTDSVKRERSIPRDPRGASSRR